MELHPVNRFKMTFVGLGLAVLSAIGCVVSMDFGQMLIAQIFYALCAIGIFICALGIGMGWLNFWRKHSK